MQAIVNAISWLGGQILDFFQYFAAWLSTTLYDWSVQFWSWAIKKLTVLSIELTISAVAFAWDIGQDILNDIGYPQFIQNAFASLPPKVAQSLDFFGIPHCVNLLSGAAVTRWVMRFIPGIA